jgi:PPOX class probable F420-dependent enzyme
MAATIPDKYLDLLQQKKAFAILATVMPDGSPQVTPVWFDQTNGLIRVNTARGRTKARTLKAGAAVAMAIVDPDNPYRYVQIRAGQEVSGEGQIPWSARRGAAAVRDRADVRIRDGLKGASIPA